MKILMTVSYDGTNYCGWQRQRGQITVQKVIEEALSRLYGEKTAILGASRTDSGVHALCQKATFFAANDKIPPDRLFLALNPLLPDDIRIVGTEMVPEDFRVINDVRSKSYVYRIQNSQVHDPCKFRYTHHIKAPLNLERMKEALPYLIGEHDFKAFCASHGGALTTVRTIFDIDVLADGDIFTIEVSGNGFLYNMVRIIAGTLADTGIGKMEPYDVKLALDSGMRERAGRTLPAKGLTLIRIEY